MEKLEANLKLLAIKCLTLQQSAALVTDRILTSSEIGHNICKLLLATLR